LFLFFFVHTIKYQWADVLFQCKSCILLNKIQEDNP
jgi:hypothetical protein